MSVKEESENTFVEGRPVSIYSGLTFTHDENIELGNVPEEELRLRCLDSACLLFSKTHPAPKTSDVIEAAEQFFEYVKR
tara:strand:+ start:1919 stop:2155 length:237 start_codon:yes stop_codon:yes gene_type:complete